MRRHLEKNNLIFYTMFFRLFKQHLSDILQKDIFLYVYGTNMWFKVAENFDAKYNGNFLYNISDKLLQKLAQKSNAKHIGNFLYNIQYT